MDQPLKEHTNIKRVEISGENINLQDLNDNVLNDVPLTDVTRLHLIELMLQNSNDPAHVNTINKYMQTCSHLDDMSEEEGKRLLGAFKFNEIKLSKTYYVWCSRRINESLLSS